MASGPTFGQQTFISQKTAAENLDQPLSNTRSLLQSLFALAFVALVLLGAPATTLASDSTASTAPTIERRGLTTIDWGVIALYAGAMLALGVYYARRQNTADEYFVASGGMNWMVVGISIMATMLSTISYLGVPGEMIKNGPTILYGQVAMPLVFCVVGFWLIPAIMRQRVTSAYELLEARTGLAGRLAAATMFISLRLIWMGLMLNLCAKALVHMLDLPEESRIWIVVTTGVVAVGYTVLGGIRAVVVSDVIQFLFLLGGAFLTIILITVHMDGFSWFPTVREAHWQEQPFYSFDPHTRVTVIGSVVTYALWHICTAGADQTLIQRYMTTKDASAARLSYLTNMCCDIVLAVTLACVGLAVLGFYSSQPELVSGAITQEADKLFPQYIANQLPVGVAGLVVVALFAAAMSSVDSGINSVTAVVMTDFCDRLGFRTSREGSDLWFARVLTLVIGVTIVLLNTLIDKIPGNFIDVTYKTVNLLTAPLFGLFFLALFVRWVTPFGAVWASIYGITTAVLVAFWGELTSDTSLSFQLIMVTALPVEIITGILLSKLPTRGCGPAVIVPLSIAAGALLGGTVGAILWWAG